jgi:anti-anti-sigma factor
MTISKNNAGDRLIISLEGRLDTTTAPQLQEQLIPEFDNVTCIQIDCKQLVYVSSAGLRVLLLGEKRAKAGNGKMILVNVSKEIREVFELTGFSDVLTFE